MSKCITSADCSYFHECLDKICIHTGIFSPDGELGLEIFSYILIIIIVGISKGLYFKLFFHFFFKFIYNL